MKKENMSNKHSFSLAEIAQSQILHKSELEACWDLVLRGIEYGMLDTEELSQLINTLHKDQDYIIEELGFELIGGQLRISFLDEKIFCPLQDMVAELEQLNERYNHIKKV